MLCQNKQKKKRVENSVFNTIFLKNKIKIVLCVF